MPPRHASAALPDVQRDNHPHCFVCARCNECGLRLQFRTLSDGAVEATFPCRSVFAGYSGMLHGGIVCALLDGAMTNCLFAHGVVAVTVDMQVRFRRPVEIDCDATVSARLESGGSPVHHLTAQLKQQGCLAATAQARFIDKEAMSWFNARPS